jgi:hypothetical protein
MSTDAPPTPEPAPSVAAIILSYNGRDLTLQTLESLLASDYPRLRVFVVDNGSTDDTAEVVPGTYPPSTHPRVELIRNPENRGISYGINFGIRAALDAGDDYLLILNNDIEFAPDTITELVRVAESDPSIGCVGPKTFYHADRDRLWSAGGKLRYREAITKERGYHQLDRGRFEKTEEVDYVNGCCMLVKRRAMLETGLWDPAYYICVEDADWCTRMKRRGYRCFYAHRALLWHMVSPTTGGYKPGRTFQTGRSTAIYVRKHAGPWGWLRFLFFFTASIPVALLRELPKGNQGAVFAKVRGVVAGLRTPLEPEPEIDPGSA